MRLLGNQAEDFYAAVGRFVLLMSVLEDRLHVLHSRFGWPQESGADSFYALIAACSHSNGMTLRKDLR